MWPSLSKKGEREESVRRPSPQRKRGGGRSESVICQGNFTCDLHVHSVKKLSHYKCAHFKWNRKTNLCNTLCTYI